jgi:PEGA domain-containing protein
MAGDTRDDETPTMPMIVVRVVSEASTVDAFVARFARYFRGDDIVFVPTEGIQPPGRRVRFVFALAGGEDLVVGDGVVLRMRRDSGDLRRPPGMELRYQILDDASQEIVERLFAARQSTPPPYVSMRIDGVSDSQQVTLPHPQAEPLPSLPPKPPSLPTKAPSPPTKPPSLSTNPPSLPTKPPSLSPKPASLPTKPPSLSPKPPSLRALPYVPPAEPSLSPRVHKRARALGAGIATGAAVLAVGIALAMLRQAAPAPAHPSAPAVAVAVAVAAGVGGNGAPVVPVSPADVAPPLAAGPRPASTGGARPPPPPPRLRPAAHAVELRVSTSPSGSTVFVDGEERGQSPLTVSIAGGTHDIVAERPRWVAAHAHVDGPGRVQLTLARPVARLRVTSTPAGAAVRLDGRDIGATPLELDADAYELHHVQLELDGHVWKRRIYLRPSGGAVRVGPGVPTRRSVDEPGPVRVAHDLGKRVRP